MVIVLLLLLGVLTFGMETLLLKTQNSKSYEEKKNEDSYKVFTFSENGIGTVRDSMKNIFVNDNGFNDQNFYDYKTSEDVKTFEEFETKVLENINDNDLGVMLYFYFHGANNGGCTCKENCEFCLQGNLCIEENRYLSGQKIADLVNKIPTQEIVIFSYSCYSGHFIEKIENYLLKNETNKTIVLVSTDLDATTTTSNISFPYFSSFEMFSSNRKLSESYLKVKNFKDYVNLVSDNTNHNFTSRGINAGDEKINPINYGFLNPKFESKYEKIDVTKSKLNAFLKEVDLSNLFIFVLQTEGTYANLKHGDMWIEAYKKNGVKQENIFFIKENELKSFTENFSNIPENARVLLLLRGVDMPESDTGIERSPIVGWTLALDKKFIEMLSISSFFYETLLKKHDSMVLILSPYADEAQKELSLYHPDLKIVCFWTADRSQTLGSIFDWKFNMISPFYEQTQMSPYNNEILNYYLSHADKFGDIKTFQDYLNWKTAGISSNIEVQTNGIDEKIDLEKFGFLPKKIPKNWMILN